MKLYTIINISSQTLKHDYLLHHNQKYQHLEHFKYSFFVNIIFQVYKLYLNKLYVLYQMVFIINSFNIK